MLRENENSKIIFLVSCSKEGSYEILINLYFNY